MAELQIRKLANCKSFEIKNQYRRTGFMFNSIVSLINSLTSRRRNNSLRKEKYHLHIRFCIQVPLAQ